MWNDPTIVVNGIALLLAQEIGTSEFVNSTNVESLSEYEAT